MQVSDPRQKRILKRLGLIGPGPTAFYQDACTLMKGQNDLLTVSHLVAHLMREIESSLRDVVLPQTKKPKQSSSDGKHKAEILTTLQVLGIPKNSPVALEWLNLPGKGNSYGLSARAHRDALNSPRLLDEEFRSFFDRLETLLDTVLDSYEAHYLESHRRIDELLTVDSPNRSHIRTLSNNIPNNLVALGYFFDSLDDGSWLELLDKEGFFKMPAEPDIDHDEGTVIFPPWPQSRYLAKVASKEPELTHSIALAIPNTNNIHIQEDLTDVALALTPALAKDFVPRAHLWLSSPYRSSLPEKLSELVVHLLKGGEIENAFELVEAVFSVHRPTTAEIDSDAYNQSLGLETNFFDDRRYQKNLKKLIFALVDTRADQTLDLLCRLLDNAIALSSPSSNVGEIYDTSYLWRPAIEEQGESFRHQILNALSSALINAIERILDNNQMSVGSIIALIEKHQPMFFERLILHVLRRPSKESRILASKRIVSNTDYLGKIAICREYALLLQGQFDYLSEEDQQTILVWIDRGPDLDAFMHRYEQRHNEAPSPNEVARHAGEWRRDRLALIVKNAPNAFNEQYETLVSEYGPAVSFTDPVYRPLGGWIGSRSPKTVEELNKMSTKKLVAFLRGWQEEDSFLGPSQEGLLNTFSDLVSIRPARFVEDIELIKLLQIDAMSALLTGLHKALEEKRAFRWTCALDLFLWIIEQSQKYDEDLISQSESPQKQSRKTILTILSLGMNESSELMINSDLRSEVWQILELLIKDPEPTPVDEENLIGQNMDPAMLSINTVRGEALHAVFHYALWVRDNVRVDLARTGETYNWFGFMPEIRDVLDAHLKSENDPSLAIRAVYGQWFPYLVSLDKSWAKEKVMAIFPAEADQSDYWEAAWSAYLFFNDRAYNDVFELLQNEYTRAVENVGAKPTDGIRPVWATSRLDERLAMHLMYLYGLGKTSLSDSDSLISRFFETATHRLRGFAISFVGRSLHNTDDAIPGQVEERLVLLLEHRIMIVQQASNIEDYVEELVAFGWWFTSGIFDQLWAFDLLQEILILVGTVDQTRWVIERLATLSKDYPDKSTECLKLIIQEAEDWRVQSRRDQIRTILGSALTSSDPNARTKAIALINRLGARGFLEYQNLLPSA